MSKKNKVLIVVFMTLLLIISFCSTCFGASNSENISFEIDGKKIILPSIPSLPDLPVNQKYFYTISSESSKLAGGGTVYYLRLMIHVVDAGINSIDGGKSIRYSTANVTLDRSKYGEDIEDYSNSNWSTLGEFKVMNDTPKYYSNYLVYSSMDLYNNGELVFQGPPHQEEGVLVPIVQETPLEGILQEIVEILPILLVIIVGLISLRKGLAFLLGILHQS